MAKQAGSYRVKGSIDGVCFYKMNGEYYVRLRSSLTGKQFWERKAFEGSRKSCKRFGEGNKIASKIYRMIEEEKREYPLFCFLKKRAILLLKEGMNVEEVEAMLVDYVFGFGLKSKRGEEQFMCKDSTEFKVSLARLDRHYKFKKVNNKEKTGAENFERINRYEKLRPVFAS